MRGALNGKDLPLLDPIVSWLRDEGGTATIARFVGAALHDPQRGYYRTGAADIGRSGDFSTVPTVHASLGRAIARWLRARRREALPAGRWHLIEVGGGGGQLAEAILRALGLAGRRRLEYHLVEASPILRARQHDRLRRFRARWHASIEDALAAAAGSAIVVSNELVDAFACHQVAWGEGSWREVYLTLVGDGLVEALGPFSDERLGSDLCSLPRLAGDRPSSARYEIHLAYLDWLSGWRPALARGRILTIDYGGTAEELLPRRGGSLRGYFRHVPVRGRDVYRRFGRQDLTADVNFTDLERWGESVGLRSRRLSTLRDFLLEWTPELERESETDAAAALVLHPAGAGAAYRVLEQEAVAAGQKPTATPTLTTQGSS